ncbi:iron-containing alcohol dehydrogenase [Anaerotalea alkaliphila]|uniref:Iron-containing alcohol dehydrogenase n=1 Tax=Anaerotalea alkaliphila TaxID=2662126 RepID=A0A7X5HWD7_9FIRM|nr:iron-containing alcohol dehydrogenase [Anaerotalea alkaliphila]NDL67872.1 iron-containing alcohol dehydrogenase [Anaerotalea alkaliphila]
MEKFNLSIPTRIHFGRGILEEALQAEAAILRGNLLVVTGRRAMREGGHLDRLEGLLRKNGGVQSVRFFQGVSPNPKVEEVDEAIRLGLETGADAVIGLGGGSALDAAKAVAAGIRAGEGIGPYLLEGKPLPEAVLPLVAIPTTAGTGSELSMGAILSAPSQGFKGGIRGPQLLPVAAIVDPAFTDDLPVGTTRETGFDIFTHGVETYLSTRANAFTRMLSREALGIVSLHLPALVRKPRDSQARDRMSYASMLMGVNLAGAGTCLPHRLQYPVGALTDTSHPRGLAALYPAWVHHGYASSPEAWDTLASLLDRRPRAGREEVEGSVCNFLEAVGMATTLEALGIREGQLETLCAGVTGNIAQDPAGKEPDIVRRIYGRALGL